MEIIVIKESQNIILIGFPEESETFINLLKDELWNVEGVIEAALIREHPELTYPKLWIKTDGISVREALKKAIENLSAKLNKLNQIYNENIRKNHKTLTSL